jgi:hypothetical protein
LGLNFDEVLIHCVRGIHRSGSTTVFVLALVTMCCGLAGFGTALQDVGELISRSGATKSANALSQIYDVKQTRLGRVCKI